MKPSNTAASIAARRTQTKGKLDRVATAIGQLRRDRGRVTVRAIAQRADVSATFLYENADARALVQNAVAESRTRRDAAGQAEHDRIEANWRERALNAEAELTRTQKEVLVQRQRIGDLRSATSTGWSPVSPFSTSSARTRPSSIESIN
ncbi:DUF6262 family protein [Streptomyces violaceusniger]|uniref:DUF6262 family protein n=1 Tax=Streptomyces violaceusniger TaxID=68280 RepID=UPI0036CFE337